MPSFGKKEIYIKKVFENLKILNFNLNKNPLCKFPLCAFLVPESGCSETLGEMPEAALFTLVIVLEVPGSQVRGYTYGLFGCKTYQDDLALIFEDVQEKCPTSSRGVCRTIEAQTRTSDKYRGYSWCVPTVSPMTSEGGQNSIFLARTTINP